VTWVFLALGSARSLPFTDRFTRRALGSVPVAAVAWVWFAFAPPLLFLAVLALETLGAGQPP